MSRILYVEDHPAQRDILAQMLELNGFEVAVAGDGIEGLEKARNWTPDLILMDLRMPHMDGFEAIKITRNEKLTNVPIIAISAWASAKHKERAILAGADEHFTKPVDLNRLLTTVNKYLKADPKELQRIRQLRIKQVEQRKTSKTQKDNLLSRFFKWLSRLQTHFGETTDQRQSEMLGHAFAATKHDLLGLLNIIQQDAQLMLGSSEQPDSAKRVWRAARNAVLLVQNLSDLRPGGALNLEDSHLPDLIDEVLDLVEPEFKGRVQIIKNYGQELPGVRVDPLRFEQVLLNLLKNAREAGAGVLTLELHGNRRGLRLKVKDNGNGLTETNADHIFKMWYTTRQGESRGLGLYIVKTILDRHGWDIEVTSNLGETCFSIIIPNDSLIEPIKNQSSVFNNTSEKTTKPKVLIVDDNADTLSLLQKTLYSSDYDLKTVWNLSEALQILGQEDYDVVVTDLRFLDETREGGQTAGLHILEVAQESSPPSQVIIVTGFGSEAIAQKSMELGAYDYMTKPINFKHLQISISKAIEARQKLYRQEMSDPQSGETPIETISIIGNSPSMFEVIDKVQIAAQSNETVLIRGEGGTGRSFIAESIHTLSRRRLKALHKINCITLPKTVGEERGNSLFLYAPNLSERNIEGAIFLDSVENLDEEAQRFFLRFIEQVKANPNADIQIISSLEGSEQATLRAELYRRLSEIEIYLPPLRERQDDIPALIGHFLRKYTLEYGLQVDIDDAAVTRLQQYTYPNNVVQLERIIKFAVRRVRQGIIHLEHLPQEIQAFTEQDPNSTRANSLKRQIQQYYKNLFMLEERRAKYSLDAPISLLNEIDSVKEEIENLTAELASIQ